jgi:hypothetical protein
VAPRSRSARAACLALSLAVVAGGATGCGDGQNSADVTTVVRKVIVRQAAARHARSKRDHDAPTQRPTAGFVFCDANVSADSTTTSCPFAENVFYAYWKNGRSGSFTAYSPATGTTYDVSCSAGATVACTGGNGAEVHFPAAAVDAYTESQADDFAAHHQTQPGVPATAASSGDGGTATASTSFCTTHECIPSFDEGNGSIVKCEDGEWSHAGGLPGACSWHGGETEVTAR